MTKDYRIYEDDKGNFISGNYPAFTIMQPHTLEHMARNAFQKRIRSPLGDMEIDYWGEYESTHKSIRTPDRRIRTSPRITRTEYSISASDFTKKINGRSRDPVYLEGGSGTICSIFIWRGGNIDWQGSSDSKHSLGQSLGIYLIKENTDISIQLAYTTSYRDLSDQAIPEKHEFAELIISISIQDMSPSIYLDRLDGVLAEIKKVLVCMYSYDINKHAWLISRHNTPFDFRDRDWPKLPWRKKYQDQNPVLEKAKRNNNKKEGFWHIAESPSRYIYKNRPD